MTKISDGQRGFGAQALGLCLVYLIIINAMNLDVSLTFIDDLLVITVKSYAVGRSQITQAPSTKV